MTRDVRLAQVARRGVRRPGGRPRFVGGAGFEDVLDASDDDIVAACARPSPR